MSPPRYPEAIRDPIHGYIRLSEKEIVGLDTPELQRLRGISQLGLTERVYPGARHSRFEHALGTLEVATRIFEDLRGRLGLEGLLPQLGLAATSAEYERLLSITRWVALLHDVGHPPFSHVTEDLLPSGRSHEDTTVDLVSGGRVAGVIASQDSTLLEEVMRVLAVMSKDTSSHPSRMGSGEERDVSRAAEDLPAPLAFVREVIAGEIGADRMDYLLRDSAATGVSYGIFDLGRILHTLLPIQVEAAGGPAVRLGVEQGGVLAIEGMLWGRVSMFQQVYFHRARRILDRHLVDFLKAVLDGGAYPDDLEDYLQWNDARVWELLRLVGGDASLSGHADARRILDRRQHRMLPREFEGQDPATVSQWLDTWRELILESAPDSQPIVDVIPPPRVVSPDLAVVRPTGSVIPLREASSWIVQFEPRVLGRMYVARGVTDVPLYPEDD